MSEIDNGEEIYRQHMAGDRSVIPVSHEGQMLTYAENLSYTPRPALITSKTWWVTLKFVKVSPPKDHKVSERLEFSFFETDTIVLGSFEEIKEKIQNNCSDLVFIMGRDFYFLADVLNKGEL